MALPTITLTGNLTADPNLRFTANGKAVTNFRVAATDRRKNATTGEWEDQGTTFLDVVVWREAETAAELTKGSKVHVVGRLKQRTYETKEGAEKTVYEVEADEVWSVVRTAGTTSAIKADDPWSTAGEAPF